MKTIRLLTTAFFFTFFANAQDFSGFRQGNYAGVQAMIYNPSNTVDSPFITDFNIVSSNIYANNDYTEFNFGSLLSGNTDDLLSETNFDINPKESNNFNLNLDILGPSALININENNGVGLFTRVRTMVTISDIDARIYDRFDDGFDDETDYSISFDNAAFTTHLWTEFGISYARAIDLENDLKLKAGLSLKYLKGFGNAHASFSNFNVTYNNADDSIDTSGSITYGSSHDFESDSYNFNPNSKGFGYDFGLNVLWNPNDSKFYFLRAGLAITDIGKITYSDATQTFYNITRNDIDVESIEGDTLEEVLEELYPGQGSKEELIVHLPTALHLNVDWNINDKFYTNLNTDIALSKKENNANRLISTYMLTPRLEKKWISLYSPISVDALGNFGWGFGLRAGPLFIGSNTILSNVLGPSKKVDLNFGLKIPIYKSKRSMNETPVSNNKPKLKELTKKERKQKEKKDKALLKKMKEKQKKEKNGKDKL